MTTYQDPPLQSRRASRQGERPEGQQPSSPFAPPQVPRTAAGAGEPLNYVTQNRPPLPGYDGAAAHGRRASEPAPQAAQEPAPQAAAEHESAPSFRPRDYSPEARTAPPAWAPEYDRDNGVLDHHTQARAAVIPPAGGSLAASLAGEPSEQTLSRRELRAIRDAAGITVPADTTTVAAQQPAPVEQVPAQQAEPVQQAPVQQAPVQQQPVQPAPAAYTPPVAPEPAPQASPPQFAPQAPVAAPSTQLDSAMAEFDALAGRSASQDPAATSRRAGRRAAPQSDVAPEDGLGAVDAMFAPTAAAPVQEPAAPQPVAEQIAPEHRPVTLPPAPAPMAQFAPVAPVEAPVVTPTTGERPIGHWTNQSDLDDAAQVNQATISRTVGSSAITTSALVLPSIPGHDMSTGEVMLTGSISLPSSLAETGAHHSIDESDIDHLLDPGDHQMVNTDSVPIRAIRAVSSHTSTRGVIATGQPKKAGRALTVLIASASVMVLVVVTLLIVALATEVI